MPDPDPDSNASPVADDWRAALATRGARWSGDGVADFGDAAAELAAAADAAALCDLSPLELLAVEGVEAENFLHNQLTSDVRALAPGRVQLSAYCTPKGRMLASFALWRRGDDRYLLAVPASVAGALRKRLSMFVLRAKVRIAPLAGARARFGVCGPRAHDAIAAALGGAPADLAVSGADGLEIVGLSPTRFLLTADAGAAATAWDRLSAVARPAGFPAWQWREVAEGIGVVVAETMEAFVPQAANWDAVGGVSFRKGCYPGQEIVARMHYLGRLKERLYRLAVDSAPPLPGESLYSPVFGAQAAGTVASAARSPRGGSEILAVVQIAAAEDGRLRLASPEGPPLELLELPYPLPAPSRTPSS